MRMTCKSGLIWSAAHFQISSVLRGRGLCAREREADAEDGLHGLDAYHSGMNEGTTLDLHLEPPALPFKGKARPSPAAHTKNPPRKRKSMESGNGARADARYSAGGGVRVGTRAERTKKSQATTHAERAKSVGVRGKIGSNRVQ